MLKPKFRHLIVKNTTDGSWEIPCNELPFLLPNDSDTIAISSNINEVDCPYCIAATVGLIIQHQLNNA